MATREGGGTKIMRGVVTAIAIVAVLVLLAVFWRQALDALEAVWDFIVGRFPDESGQRVAVVVYLILSVLLGILFSKAGHFTAYGIVMALGPLLWFLFWEGFPLLGLDPTWKASLGVSHLEPGQVILWAVVADLVVTLVFVPLELWEKYRHRRRSLGID
ncbi:hypothetical protein F4553_006680 [Allocatelliglobosispora scoriae]|uniref:Uncharacterized protein n=1 Tax=Allocatelliglobosispora scoriae TaxID=643052 RepID=A0A841C073_9ACTN|nr:hypothetical protein [Allocatelliglobosispora scoriae]MBB5873246.1 hypothetical protein [Allocatelliglobosispora scoriae]